MEKLNLNFKNAIIKSLLSIFFIGVPLILLALPISFKGFLNVIVMTILGSFSSEIFYQVIKQYQKLNKNSKNTNSLNK